MSGAPAEEPRRGLGDVVDLADLALVLRHLRRRDARRRGGSPRSYRELAETTGWSLGIIGGYLSGKILPPTDRFDTLVRLLGAEPAELAGLATARDRVEERRRRAAATPPAGPPAQLPADPPAFVGRAAALDRLDAAAAAAAAPVIVVTGTAGVGKSALAVRWAHRARDRFPDGQLFVNLRGYAATAPVQSRDALAAVLRTLGVPAAQVPDDPDEAGGLYRTLLAGRRMLLLLDDARGPEQVRPLLPGVPGCTVLVTSRDQLLGLRARDGAVGVPVDVLDPADAHALLVSAVGAQRVEAEPAAAAGLARVCGFLPLAVRIVAATLLGRPDLSLGAHLRRMTGDDRLSRLELDGDPDSAVRGAFEPSYRALPEPARETFRLLGLAPGPDLGDDAVSALLGADADRALDALTRAHLVVRADDGRIVLHDLLRCYAAERAAAELTAGERAAAVGRLLDFYAGTAFAAAVRLHPERLRLPGGPADTFDSPAAALSWLDAERAALLAAAGHAAAAGRPAAAVRIADALRGYASQTLPTAAWADLGEIAVAAAEADGDPHLRAAAHLGLAEARWRQGRYDAARQGYAHVAELSRTADWSAGEVAALGNLGTVCLLTGRVREAVEHLERALTLTDRPASRALTLGSLGAAHRELGDLPRSVSQLTEALEVFRSIGSRVGEAIALNNLGESRLTAGEFDVALTHVAESLALFREAGSRVNEAVALRGLAAVHLAAGRPAEAAPYAEQAYEICAEVADRRLEMDTLGTLGGIRAATDPTAGTELYLRALHLARGSGNRYPETEILVSLAELQLRLGRTEAAHGWADQAAAVAAECGYRLLAARAAAVLGSAPAGHSPERTASR
jgi:tetratricopeptide (TPR) repeat protein